MLVATQPPTSHLVFGKLTERPFNLPNTDKASNNCYTTLQLVPSNRRSSANSRAGISKPTTRTLRCSVLDSPDMT